ncbi:hypothetical protein [Burkholderia stabilis]|uniref:hypothetical protein n=1 Tax=Burkholderia stabilis TaxID=95485 RepID=UPI00164896B8|nr:hypothetical protein [Burkholderia stabilis]
MIDMTTARSLLTHASIAGVSKEDDAKNEGKLVTQSGETIGAAALTAVCRLNSASRFP